MRLKKTYSVILLTCLIAICASVTNLPSASSQTSEVPDWIKNNAKWWAEGLITEREYMIALQYLADEGILQISTAEIVQFDGEIKDLYDPAPKDDNRAQSYIVRFSGGELEYAREVTTFTNFIPGDKAHFLKTYEDFGLTAFFILESNPSRDKLGFYEMISRYYNPGKEPELFDVKIDVLSGNNIPIVTAQYAKCRITEHYQYLQDLIIVYQFSGLQEEEIRDRTVFYCSGFNVLVNESNNNQEPELTKPAYDDRVTSYVVHFFGGDFETVYSQGTFITFSPSEAVYKTPYDVISSASNTVGTKPQFYLESLPSQEKKQLYKVYASYVNLGKKPELFNVSIDSILGDGTILHRWNYRDCDLVGYGVHLEESLLRYSVSRQHQPEIRDKSDFRCNGISFDVGVDLPQTPIRDANTIQGIFTGPQIINLEDKSDSYVISVFGGEFTETLVGENVFKFESVRRDRGPLTPIHHAKQYDFGFIVESLPSQEKKHLYEFLSRYTNPGKTPEPFDVTLDILLGDGSVLHRLHYTNCEAVDFMWYRQGLTWLYQFSNTQQEEIRERYAFFCGGFKIEFP